MRCNLLLSEAVCRLRKFHIKQLRANEVEQRECGLCHAIWLLREHMEIVSVWRQVCLWDGLGLSVDHPAEECVTKNRCHIAVGVEKGIRLFSVHSSRTMNVFLCLYTRRHSSCVKFNSSVFCVRWFKTDVSKLHIGSVFRLFSFLFLLGQWLLKLGPIGSPETSVVNHLTPPNNSEDGIIQFSRGGSLQSRIREVV
jgi:hypothetical protein